MPHIFIQEHLEGGLSYPDQSGYGADDRAYDDRDVDDLLEDFMNKLKVAI